MTDLAYATNRLVLLAPRRESQSKIRRYRIARLKLEGSRPAEAARGTERFAHLKRVYD